MPTPVAVLLGLVISGVVLRYFVRQVIADFRKASPTSAAPAVMSADAEVVVAWTVLDDLQFRRCVDGS